MSSHHKSIHMLLALAAMVTLVACNRADGTQESVVSAVAQVATEQVPPSLPCPCNDPKPVVEEPAVPVEPTEPKQESKETIVTQQETDTVAQQKKTKKYKVITIAVPIDEDVANIELLSQAEEQIKETKPNVDKKTETEEKEGEPEVEEAATTADDEKQEPEAKEEKVAAESPKEKPVEKQDAPSSKSYEKKVKISSKVKLTSKDGNQKNSNKKETNEAKMDRKRSKRDTKGSKKSSKNNKKSSKGNKSEKKSKSRK